MRLLNCTLATLFAFGIVRLAGAQTAPLRHGSAHLDHAVSGVVTPSPLTSTPTHLTIVPSYDSSITNDPNGAAIEVGIEAALATLESHIQTPIVVKILF